MSDQPQPTDGNGVAPQPVPCTVNVARASTPNGPLIVLQFATFTGTQVLFFTPDEARHIASIIQQTAGGIVVPTSPLLDGLPS